MTEITRQEKAALMDAVRLGAMTALGEVVCMRGRAFVYGVRE